MDVVVANPDGRTATSPAFHYGPAPSISSQVVFTAPKLNAGWYQLVVTSSDGQYAVGPTFLVYASCL